MSSNVFVSVQLSRRVIRTLQDIYQSIHTDPRACKVVTPSETKITSYPKDYVESASLYIHWPYCQRRCSYCNFNKYINNNADQERMKACFIQEIKTLRELSGVKSIKSIFFGGGTPSLAEPSVISSIVESVNPYLINEAEITMECNPTSTESVKLEQFKQAGINRVSLGLQALVDADLTVLGRDHSVMQSLQCVKTAKQLFPGRVSLDIMFGRPSQSLSSWERELEMVIGLCDNHISLYQLTLERGTQLFKSVSKKLLTLPADHILADMYQYAVGVLNTHGFSRYEVSNFARNGAESRHNMSYWNGQLYIGAGPGAHGRFIYDGCREARVQTLEPDPWMNEVEKYGHGTRRRVRLSVQECLEEILMTGLRTTSGVLNQSWNIFSDRSLIEIFGDSSVVKELCERRLLILDGQGMRATPSGLSVVDSILPELFVAMDNVQL